MFPRIARAITRCLQTGILSCMTASLVPLPASAQEPSVLSLAREVGQQLAAGQLAAVHARLSENAREALPLPKFEEIWRSLQKQFGDMTEVGTPLAVSSPDRASAAVPMKFAHATLYLKITARNGTIEGLQFVPRLETWTPPPYAQPDLFTEVDLEFGRPGLRLPATLTLPKGAARHPAVVLVHGSGPNDRDETIGPNKPFKDLAHGLASRGIAVLRYEKRSRMYPGSFKSRAFTVHDEVLEDAALAVELLAAREEIAPDRIFVLGHSLGGTLAPRIPPLAPKTAGLIIAAGATRPLPQLMLEQTSYLATLNGSTPASQAEARTTLARDVEKALAARPSPDATLVLGAPMSYWGDLNAVDPAKSAAEFKGRILILQGGRDYQVTLEDLERYQTALAGRTDTRIKVYPDLNHLFMEGSGKSTPAEYAVRSPVAKSVIDDIAAFVTAP